MKFKTLDAPVEAKREIRVGDVYCREDPSWRAVIVGSERDGHYRFICIWVNDIGGVGGCERLSAKEIGGMQLIGRVRNFDDLTLEIEPV